MAEQSGTLTLTLPSDREIVMTRVYDAPPELVFEAHSKCKHLQTWLGPRGFELIVCEVDFRPGGAYRFVQRGPDGTEYGFRGEYREILPPQRIVQTSARLSSIRLRTATGSSSRGWRRARGKRGSA